jgi:hypothetical protein
MNLNILIHLVSQSVSDKAWEGGFVFSRAQRCRQDGGSGFWMKVGQHGRAGHERGAGQGDWVLTEGSGNRIGYQGEAKYELKFRFIHN